MTLFDRAARKLMLSAALLVALAGTAAHAGEPPRLTDASFNEIHDQLKSAEGHPNEQWRLQGLKRYVGGNYDVAVEYFKRAASYADKYSQHYLSLMYWHGVGMPADPVQAYIWADLAAERGSRTLLLMREKMWSQLTPQQQRDAMAQGDEFYARYGDEVAKPRAETEIRRFSRNMTGSRVGFNNSQIDIQMGGPIHGSFGGSPGMLAASAMVVGTSSEQQFYADDRTKVGEYWQTQDRMFEGSVEVGPLEPVREPTPPKSNGMSI